jgi:hypothetical protein
LYALQLKTEEGSINIFTETPGLFFKLYNPENPPHATAGVTPKMPEGDLSFLHQISPIGNKFAGPETMGPSGETKSGQSVTEGILLLESNYGLNLNEKPEVI